MNASTDRSSTKARATVQDTKTLHSGSERRPIQAKSTKSITVARQTEFEGRYFDQNEWEDMIRRHELYLMVLIFVYMVVAFLIGLLSVFGHTNDAFKWNDKKSETDHHGGIWYYCTNTKEKAICEAVNKKLLDQSAIKEILRGDEYSSYVAARAFLIMAQIYNVPLIIAPMVILCMKLYNQVLFCGMTLTGLSLCIWLIVSAAIMTSLFNDNCPSRSNCAGWSVNLLWVCTALCILVVALPICMFCTTKRIDEMKQEEERQKYEPIHEPFDMKIEHHE
ncbi:uncharacterized protein LOC142344071 [Convolutriloba macropyga]|uniref:uncharacterized protein LOC142344071 n=1 Tax=Convolutriloba macropyga TaxID=536237 RepID=UPI003F5226E7